MAKWSCATLCLLLALLACACDEAGDEGAASGTESALLGPNPLIDLVTPSISDGEVGLSYFQQLTAQGGSGDYHWEIIAGALPSGLTLGAAGTPSTVIQGSPINAGEGGFIVRVTDSAGNTDTQRYRLTVFAPLTITTPTLPNVHSGETFYAAVKSTGGAGGNTWDLTYGSLPPNWTMEGEGLSYAIIQGVSYTDPTTPLQFNFIVRVRDRLGASAEQQYFVHVSP